MKSFFGTFAFIRYSIVVVALSCLSLDFVRAVDKDNGSLKSPALAQLASYIAGSFSNAAQAAADTSYHDNRMYVLPVWLERKDALWFYVEQARAEKPDQPFRQRIYRISEQRDGQFVNDIHTLPVPSRFIGAYRTPFIFDSLQPEQLDLRKGCSVTMRQINDTLFVGQTTGSACSSEMRGAQYATSEISLGPSGVASWDRGFDSSGKQVWGAESSGYLYRRVKK